MDNTKIGLLICQNFIAELEAVLQEINHKNITVATFQANCTWLNNKQKEKKSNTSEYFTSEVECVKLLSSKICIENNELTQTPNNCINCKQNKCHYLIAPKSLIEQYTEDGYYIISSGWLKRWNLNQITTPPFLKKSHTQILLLNTGIDPEFKNSLVEFSDFVGLPYKIINIGIDHFKYRIESIIYKLLNKQAEDKKEAIKQENSMKLANYEILFDFIPKFIKKSNEKEIIDAFFNLATILIAPQRIVWYQLSNGNITEIISNKVNKTLENDKIFDLFNFSTPYKITENNKGFKIKIKSNTEISAFILIENIMFPQHINSYYQVLDTLTILLGLFISNVRKYNIAIEAKKTEKKQKNIITQHNNKLQSYIEEYIAQNEELYKTKTIIEESEKQYRMLFNTMIQGVIYQNTDGEIISANPSAEKILGLSFDKMQGRLAIDLRWKTIHENYTNFLDETLPTMVALKTGKRVKNVTMGVFHPKLNDYKWILVNAVPLFRNNEKKPYQVYAIFEDITDRRKANQKLKESEEKFKSLFQNMNSGLALHEMVFDKTGTPIDYIFLDVNDTFKKLTGTEGTKMRGKKVTELFPGIEKDTTDWIGIYGKVALTGINISFENYLSVLNKWYSIIAYRPKKGQFAVIFSDITEKKKIEKELIKSKQEAETANRLKSEFLANMSHEIRTPMNAVLGFSEILNTKLSDKPEYKPFIEGIIKGGENLISLINDILDLSKIEAGLMEIKPETVNIKELVKDIKQIFAVSIEKKNIQLILDIDKKLPQTIFFDQTRIRQILFNLIGNAVKFTDNGSISVLVSYKKDTKADNLIELYFEIKDTGIGIPENQIDNIFEAFRQIKGQSAKYGGTGLGLPITKRLIEAMNGKITVESQIGKGSEFRIHFKKVIITDDIASKSMHNTPTTTDEIRFNSPHILIADDSASNRNFVVFNLKETNCNVFEVENGIEAIDFAANNRVDLIIMDIQMPELNGYEATKRLKANKKLNKIPIIALTAYAMNEQVEKYGHIFDDYLKKPITIENLIKCLIKFLPYKEIKPDNVIDIKVVTYAEKLASHIKEKGRLSEAFMKIYRDEIFPLYEEVNDIMDIEDCKEFTTILSKAGKEYNIKCFTAFSTELLKAIENYQLKEIESLLEDFGNITNELKTKTL